MQSVRERPRCCDRAARTATARLAPPMGRGIVVLLAAFFAAAPLVADDLIVDGTTLVLTSDRTVDGSVFIENGGHLVLRDATLTLELDFDEEHHIDISDDSRFTVENGRVTSTGGQYWIELSGDPGTVPTMEVSGAASLITNHSGIRPFGDARVIVTGGDVEELQVRERTRVTVSDAATYPVFFFDGVTASLSNLDTGDAVSNTISVPGGWSFVLDDAQVEGYQIDLLPGASITLDSGDGIVASFHTPGDLGDELRIVEGVTSDDPISGAVTNLGSSFVFSDTNVALLNVYLTGRDRVLLRDVHVNEVNAEGQSELVVGQKGMETRLNCNLCQVYDRARFTVVEATIDASDNLPSATAAFGSADPVGTATMTFVNMDLRELDLTAIERGTLSLRNCEVDEGRVVVVDPTAAVEQPSLVADFTADRLSGAAPLTVEFLDHSAGAVDVWEWTFGDGTSSSLPAPIHTYTRPGTYTVALAVRRHGGASHITTREGYITVTGGGGAGGDCVADGETLCLQGGRFQVRTTWRTPQGARSRGRAVRLTADTGYFWFFDDGNVEAVVKVLDGCPVNERFWVFAAGLTDVEVELEVTDTGSGAVRRYRNPAQTPFQPVQDSDAFATCP